MTPAAPPTVSAAAALAVAEADALAAYGDLRDYYTRLQRYSDGWYINFLLIDRTLNGGGPHYVVDRHTGQILRKKYEQ
jgi:hypothetical protein